METKNLMQYTRSQLAFSNPSRTVKVRRRLLKNNLRPTPYANFSISIHAFRFNVLFVRNHNLYSFFFLIFLVCNVAVKAQERPCSQKITMTIDLAHPTRVADFSKALGAGIDGHVAGETEKMLSPNNIKTMLTAGLKPLSYRLRTELGMEAWHWNPSGTWSDAKNQQGYWTSSTHASTLLKHSYGYRLPRRGDTFDEANNDSYSRLDDGDPTTFWKSNPYLTSHYTGESDSLHPQWILIDFGKPLLVNGARLHWKDPYAKKFRIQYSQGGDLYFGHHRDWHDFPKGKFVKASGGSPLLDLGTPRTFFGQAIPVRFIRILMSESSERGSSFSADLRDHEGYALGEVEVGFLKQGKLQDHIVHRPDQQQTVIYVSSTDPWHRACDLDKKTEQPGLDLVAKSGLGNHQPILWSIPIFYDTPENAAAIVDFLKERSYLFPSQRFELGEEPDGQRVDPKDVGELYAQVAKKICSSAHSKVTLGGLSLVTLDVNPGDLIYRVDKRPWLRQFFKQLQKKGERSHFQFLTFEWYPFDDLLLSPASILTQQPRRLQATVRRIRHGGIPSTMPLMISEYGYSVFSGQPEVELSAALLNADIAAQFLLLGGTTSYLYGYEPNQLECTFNPSWGNLMMFLQDGSDGIQPLPTYYGAQLITQQWGPASGGPCEIYPVTTDIKNKEGDPLVTAYFLHARDGGKERYSFLLVNKDPKRAYRLRCRFDHLGIKELLVGSWESYSYSPAQYQWQMDGAQGHPRLNEPPLKGCCQARVQSASNGSFIEFQEHEHSISIPPWSITVLRKKRACSKKR